MGINTATNIADASTAMVGDFHYTLQHEGLMKNLCVKQNIPKGVKSFSSTKLNAFAASGLTDGIDITDSQTVIPTATSVTASEVGVKCIITDKARHELATDAFAMIGRQMGDAMSKKLDQDGLALFSGLNSGLGTAGTAITLGYIHAATAQCLGQSEPMKANDMVCIIHPYQLAVIVETLALPAYNSIFISDEDIRAALRGYWSGNTKLFNVPIFQDGNISVDSSDDAYGALFSKYAFFFAQEIAPNTEKERDASLRAWEVVMTHCYGFVEREGSYGRYLLFDATAPSS